MSDSKSLAVSLSLVAALGGMHSESIAAPSPAPARVSIPAPAPARVTVTPAPAPAPKPVTVPTGKTVTTPTGTAPAAASETGGKAVTVTTKPSTILRNDTAYDTHPATIVNLLLLPRYYGGSLAAPVQKASTSAEDRCIETYLREHFGLSAETVRTNQVTVSRLLSAFRADPYLTPKELNTDFARQVFAAHQSCTLRR